MKINNMSAVRLAYIFTLLFLVLGTCVTVSLGYEMRAIFMWQINENLVSEVTEAYGESMEPHDVAHLAPNVKMFTLTDREYRYLLQDNQGHVIAGDLSSLSPIAGFRSIEDARSDTGHGQRLYGLGIKLVDGGYYFVAHDTALIDTLRSRVLEIALVGCAAFLLCGLGGGVLMGVLVRRRLVVIGQTLQDIKRGDLTVRLPVASGRDELDDLCEMFNDVLKQNESLVEKIRQVSNNIAHDMRTPLTRLRHRLQRVASGPQDDARSEAQMAIEDLDVSLEIFSSLLQLAEIESIRDLSALACVNLSYEVVKCLEIFESTAEDSHHRIQTSLAPSIMVRADAVLLQQLICNILDNALIHTPSGTVISISVIKVGDQAKLCIADNGPGVPSDLLPKLSERFFRLDRSRSTPGTGLGISLANAITEHLGGVFALEDNAPGLRVLITLPLFDPSPIN